MPNPTQNNFTKGMNKDVSGYLLPASSWTHARNLIPASNTGDEGGLVTESALLECITFPYTLIGAIALDGSQWMVFCTDDTNSEIGIIDIDNCSYTKFSNTPCLGFKKSNLITGASRRNYDCGFNVYWSDGLNPDRYVNTNTTDVNNNIWIQDCTTVFTGGTSCTTCVNTDVLNCDNIRIAPLMNIPCITVAKGTTAGTLLNGTYQIALAYAVNGIKVTDYVILSNPQSIFSHTNQAGSITCNITGADRIHFKEMLVTVISFVNNQLVAKRLGIFDTDQETISISSIDSTLPSENLANIPLQTPALEKSDSIWNVNTYLLRNGIYEKPEFNYQPLANQITTNWVLKEVLETYYHNAGDDDGMDIGYLRDEVYCFFIRWIYNTGDKSASYHIPGRAFDPATDTLWVTQNTGSVLGGGTGTGMYGKMSYWESSEKYPDHQGNVFDSNVPGHPEWDLCGKPIRHHRFPDQTISPDLTHFTSNNTIRILGVRFSNIKPPLDNTGQPITNIVGYEILRGSREGNKSIIAKGMINNMREYPAQSVGDTPGLYQNYPYNDLQPDRYLTTSQTIGTVGGTLDIWAGNTLDNYRNDIFSFHSPDTVFSHPFLGTGNLRVYQTLIGTSIGHFERPYKHPKFKLLTKVSTIFTDSIAIFVTLKDVAQVLAGGVDYQFAATPDLPFTTPLGLNLTPAEGSYGVLGDATYAAQIIYNAIIVGFMAPLELKTLQQQILNLITGLVPAKQYAVQYNSTGFYNEFKFTPTFNAAITNYQYIKGFTQGFEGFFVNNLYRNDYVILKAGVLPPPTLPTGGSEVSRFTLGQCPSGSDFNQIWVGDPNNPGIPNLTSYYAGYKVIFPSQYGQLGSIREIPISGCIYPTIPNPLSPYISPTLFGGDIYINRYTEKNAFLYFTDWLINVPDDFQYDYTNFENVPYPRYWINNTHVYYDFWADVTKNYHLDEYTPQPWDISFYVHDGFFYLFNNGVRDFYVESDVNVGFRNWGEETNKHFYDPYGYKDIEYMFRSDLIKSDIFYDYDYSLSVNKFYSQYISFGQVLGRDYDPDLAYTCAAYYPRRIAYSLPQTEELKVDNWRQFLPNNFYDFYTPVTAVKSSSKTGAIFLMKEQSPVKFEGVQVLQQGEPGAVAITVGDGGLFNQPLNNVINIDKGLGYGSSVSRYSICSTPHGTFYVGQKEGNVFLYADQYKQNPYTVTPLEEISSQGMNFWFQNYLPSKLLKQFPNYPYPDNPVIGVGVTMSYDETQEILYICKKDYKLKSQYLTQVTQSGSLFILKTPLDASGMIISLTNPTYFEDCSFTISWDCKEKYWIGFHDWKPSWQITGRNHNYSIKDNTLWRHNVRTDKFANYYDTDYPVEIAFPVNTQGTITTLRNVSYYLESYYYQPNGIDRFQVYDKNFDHMMLWNDEQFSGLLVLHPQPANPFSSLQYPIYGLSSIDVLYSKKENHYRVNQFTDQTKNRGEYIPTFTQMFITDENGYTFSPNVLYTDYTKSALQLKKFRNYNNTVWFRTTVSDSLRQFIRLANEEHQISPR